MSIDYSRQLRYKGKKKGNNHSNSRVGKSQEAVSDLPPSCASPARGCARPLVPTLLRATAPELEGVGKGRPREGGHVSESVLRAAALPSETAQFNQCPGTPGQGWGGSLHSRGGRGRLLGPGRTRSSWAEAAGAAHRAQVWDSAEVRGRRSGAPRCGFLWGDRGTAWGSGKPLWAGCSWSAVLQEGGRQQKRA